MEKRQYDVCIKHLYAQAKDYIENCLSFTLPPDFCPEDLAQELIVRKILTRPTEQAEQLLLGDTYYVRKSTNQVILEVLRQAHSHKNFKPGRKYLRNAAPTKETQLNYQKYTDIFYPNEESYEKKIIELETLRERLTIYVNSIHKLNPNTIQREAAIFDMIRYLEDSLNIYSSIKNHVINYKDNDLHQFVISLLSIFKDIDDNNLKIKGLPELIYEYITNQFFAAYNIIQGQIENNSKQPLKSYAQGFVDIDANSELESLKDSDFKTQMLEINRLSQKSTLKRPSENGIHIFAHVSQYRKKIRSNYS